MTLFNKIPFELYLIAWWVVSILAVNPLGEFPLNDDFAYAKSVWHLFEQGELTLHTWTAATLVGQVLWGALFCQLFGLSFFALRLSTLAAGLLGVIALYRIGRLLFPDNKPGVLAALLLLFNPMYFSLSFTFMTDVPFITAVLWTIYFFTKYLKQPGWWPFMMAVFFSLSATLIRQPGILPPVVFGMAILLKYSKARALLGFVPFVISLAALMIHSEKLAGGANSISILFSELHVQQFIDRVSSISLYMGLFLFPLVLLFWKQVIRQTLRIRWLAIPVVLVVGLLAIISVRYPEGNILYNLGLGPKVMKDTVWLYNIHPQLPPALYVWVIKGLSLAGVAGLLVLLWQKVIAVVKHGFSLFSTFSVLSRLSIAVIWLGYAAFLILNPHFFDRYTLPLVALGVLLIIPKGFQWNRGSSWVFGVAMAVAALFSIAATHDYLSWNRARWTALDYLTEEKGIAPGQIDGGFEFNAWHETGPMRPMEWDDKSWWFVGDDQYVIAFGKIEGFEKMKGYPYAQVLPGSRDSVYVLKRQGIMKDETPM